MPEQQQTITWARRLMRHPGTSVQRNDFRPQPWHIQSPEQGHGNTYCGRYILRYYHQREEHPAGEQPEGRVCAECVATHSRGEHPRPLGRGPRKRRP